MNSLLEDLKQRRVVRAVATYVAASWFIVQIAGTLAPLMRLPEWAIPMVVYLLVLGLPVVLALSWMFDLRPTGLVAAQEPDPPAMQRRKLLALTAIGVVACGLFYGFLAFVSGPLAGRAAAADAGPQAPAEAHSLAVLPFDDLSPDEGQRWFAEGLADEVINALAASGGVRLAPRSAAARFTSTADLRQVGQELAVARLLQGSVRRVGGKVRVSVQLIDAGTGFQLWSRAYDGRLDDILRVQAEIAAAIVVDLNVELGLAPRPTRPSDVAEIGG